MPSFDGAIYRSAMNGTISGDLSGTITSGFTWVLGTTNNTKGELQMESESDSNQMALTIPVGATSSYFRTGLSFNSIPAVGTYTQADASVQGGFFHRVYIRIC